MIRVVKDRRGTDGAIVLNGERIMAEMWCCVDKEDGVVVVKRKDAMVV